MDRAGVEEERLRRRRRRRGPGGRCGRWRPRCASRASPAAAPGYGRHGRRRIGRAGGRRRRSSRRSGPIATRLMITSATASWPAQRLALRFPIDGAGEAFALLVRRVGAGIVADQVGEAAAGRSPRIVVRLRSRTLCGAAGAMAWVTTGAGVEAVGGRRRIGRSSRPSDSAERRLPDGRQGDAGAAFVAGRARGRRGRRRAKDEGSRGQGRGARGDVALKLNSVRWAGRMGMRTTPPDCLPSRFGRLPCWERRRPLLRSKCCARLGSGAGGRQPVGVHFSGEPFGGRDIQFQDPQVRDRISGAARGTN